MCVCLVEMIKVKIEMVNEEKRQLRGGRDAQENGEERSVGRNW